MTSASSSLPGDEIQRILEKRAAILTKPPRQERVGEAREVLVMHVGDERYGVDVRQVVEVRPVDALTPVPGLPSIWAGLVNLRGVIYPVLHGPRYLGVETVTAENSHVVVITAGTLVVGFLADHIAGLRTIPVEDIEPPLGADAQAHRKAVSGVTSDLLLLLDVETLLQDPALVVDDEAS